MRPAAALKHAAAYALSAVKWLPAAALIGLVGGAVGAAFHFSVQYVAGFRLADFRALYLLPVGAVMICLLYRLFRLPEDIGTNLVLEAIRSEQRVPAALTPVIFLGTVLTHFVGGSAGREGAALQLGGSVASAVARLLRVHEEQERHLLILCGMAAVFSALFGTPATAAIFVLEVVSVGRFYYFALLPCLTASAVAFGLSRLVGGGMVRLTFAFSGPLTAVLTLQTAALAVLCALLSILFCVVVHRCSHYAVKYLKNPYLRALILGAALLGMTLLTGGQTYNGAGMDFVERAVSGGQINWYDFLLKLIFTAITLAAGYKGGEIVPAFFVGAAFGAVAGPLLWMDAGFAAAVGMIAVFCGVLNCPFASVFLGVEVFGGAYLLPIVVTCAVSYIFSGYFGLYSSQHILRSKVGTELIDRHVDE